ncbi:type II secretion system protein J [Deinococcus ficus]|uniref:type II secretion system protein J n=1 Tax=Deinococcus ficus TaxID=317577 RepID=UPI003570F8CA
MHAQHLRETDLLSRPRASPVKRAGAAQGFTLVELLIAMGLLGIVLTLVMNWQMSTLNISTRTNALVRSLNDLNDLTGYVGDRVRSAVRVHVFTSGTINTGTTSSTSTLCSPETPCLALVLPVTTPDTGVVTGFDQYIYRMSNRANVSSDDKADDVWADTSVGNAPENPSKITRPLAKVRHSGGKAWGSNGKFGRRTRRSRSSWRYWAVSSAWQRRLVNTA